MAVIVCRTVELGEMNDRRSPPLDGTRLLTANVDSSDQTCSATYLKNSASVYLVFRKNYDGDISLKMTNSTGNEYTLEPVGGIQKGVWYAIRIFLSSGYLKLRLMTYDRSTRTWDSNYLPTSLEGYQAEDRNFTWGTSEFQIN